MTLNCVILVKNVQNVTHVTGFRQRRCAVVVAFSTASLFLTRENCRFERDRVDRCGRQRPQTAFLENYRPQIVVSSRFVM